MRLNLKMSTAQRFTNLVCCTQSLPCFVSVLRRWSRPKFYVRIWKINQQSCFHLVTGCTIFVATNYFGFRSCLVVAFGCFVAVNVKYFERCILTSEIWSQVSSKQCNQIWQIFEILAKQLKSLAICESVFCIWQTFEPTLAKVLCYWANYHCCKWPKYYQVTLVVGSLHRNYWWRTCKG